MIVSPYLGGTARGNSTQAERKAGLLAGAGWQVSLIGLSNLSADGEPERVNPKAIEEAMSDARPNVVVVIHAIRGRVAVEAARALGLPLVIATGGTDVVPGLEGAESRTVACRSFGMADLILAQSSHQKGLIQQH